MQNHYITSEREGCRIPELWYMFARSGNIFITLTAVCMQKLENLKLREEKGFSPPSTEKRWGFDSGFQPLHVRQNGTFTLVIPIREQVETVSRSRIAESVAWFMEILNFLVVPTTGQLTSEIPGKQFQLFSVSTYNNGGNFHGSALGVSISPEAAEFLDKHSESTIPGAHRSMREHNHALYPDDSRQDPVFLRIDLQGVIREHGTISFKTFGNCACLGDAPEQTEKGRGKYATSHNLDRPWQQLSMLVGIATMWRWVRTKLAYK